MKKRFELKGLLLAVFAIIIIITNLPNVSIDSEEDNNVFFKITSNGAKFKNIEESKKGVYSWIIDDLIHDTLNFANICNKLDISEVFQEIPRDYFNDDLVLAIKRLKDNTKNNIDISYLCGDASWYNNSDHTKAEIDTVVSYNTNYGYEYPITKIVFDIEPWTLGENEWVDEFLNTIKETYSYAKANNITLFLTIPFWLDTSEDINDDTFYKEIIKYSDGVIVMNYNRYACFEAIDNEVNYVKEKGKLIYSAAETQEPNTKYGVDDSITYYNVGLNKLMQDWICLEEKYKYSGLGFVYHDFNSLKALYNTKM